LSICSILLTLCFVLVFILFSVLPYGEIKLCIISPSFYADDLSVYRVVTG